MRGRYVAQYQTFVRFELPKDELRVLMATGLMQGFQSTFFFFPPQERRLVEYRLDTRSYNE